MFGLKGRVLRKYLVWLFGAPVVGAMIGFFGMLFYETYRDVGVPLATFQMSAEGLLAMMMGALGLLIGAVVGIIGGWRVQSREIAQRRISRKGLVG
jgi:hypothetical protein